MAEQNVFEFQLIEFLTYFRKPSCGGEIIQFKFQSWMGITGTDSKIQNFGLQYSASMETTVINTNLCSLVEMVQEMVDGSTQSVQQNRKHRHLKLQCFLKNLQPQCVGNKKKVNIWFSLCFFNLLSWAHVYCSLWLETIKPLFHSQDYLLRHVDTSTSPSK